MNYQKLREQARQFQSITSLNVSEFDTLISPFEVHLKDALCYTARGTLRKNKISFSKYLPDAEHVLFCTLSYLKLNPLQSHHAASFDMSQEALSRWVKIGISCLNKTLKKLGHAPCRVGEKLPAHLLRNNEDESKDDENGANFFIDASESSIQRAKTGQKEDYSGKSHRHTMKHTYISNRSRKSYI